MPPRFPVFSKPIINLKGMGIGSRIVGSRADYEAHYTPGHFWMPLLTGRHVSSDLAVVDGAPRWWRHVTGEPAGEGTFDYWTVHAEADAAIEQRCGQWVKRHLAGYTGMVDLETIGGTIIEVHLRFADQWPDLYGPGWVDALVGLYENGTWDFANAARRDGYSVVLFGPTGRRWRHPPAEAGGRNQTGCRASAASRLPSTRTSSPSGTRCRPAAFVSPSSTASISQPHATRATGSGTISIQMFMPRWRGRRWSCEARRNRPGRLPSRPCLS